jgi:hypothetical protein
MARPKRRKTVAKSQRGNRYLVFFFAGKKGQLFAGKQNQH